MTKNQSNEGPLDHCMTREPFEPSAHEPCGEHSAEVRNAFAYLRTIEIACDARDDRQSVTYIGQVRELILKLARAAQPPVHEHARPLSEWSEAQGPVVWWAPPIREASYIGHPSDSDWPGYHTHWTPHPKVPANIKEQQCVCGGHFLGPDAVELRDSYGGMHYPKNPCTAPTKGSDQ